MVFVAMLAPKIVALAICVLVMPPAATPNTPEVMDNVLLSAFVYDNTPAVLDVRKEPLLAGRAAGSVNAYPVANDDGASNAM